MRGRDGSGRLGQVGRAKIGLVPHLIEPAATGRSKCRGCGEAIAAGVLRFGETVPNAFGEGDATHWFHLDCGAFSCKATIAKGAWRIPLVFYEEGRFMPSGFVHAACAPAYFETTDVMPRLQRFAKGLTEADLAEIGSELQRGTGPLA
jgi:hypothetical protein